MYKEISVDEEKLIDNFYGGEEEEKKEEQEPKEKVEEKGKEEEKAKPQEQEQVKEPKQEQKEKQPSEPPPSELPDTPSNRAFAAMRVELKQYRQEVERAKQEAEEARRRLAFIEQQQQQQAKQMELEQKREQNRIYLQQLQTADPERYEIEKNRILREEIEEGVASKIAPQAPPQFQQPIPPQSPTPATTPQQTAEAQSRINMVNAKIEADFPDITDHNSALFKKAQEILFTQNTPQDIDFMLSHRPEMFYTNVALAAQMLENEKLQKQLTDTSRQERVANQGAAHSTGQSTNTPESKLTPEQLAWCKRMGFNPKEYAKYVFQMKEEE